MELSFQVYIPRVELLLVFLCAISCICGRRFAESGYYPDNYYNGQSYDKIDTALSKLEHAPTWVKDWPDASIKLGQVSGVALDNEGRLLVFHRASNVWDASTFTTRDVYQGIGEPPIPHPTVMVFNSTGELVDMWGQNLFYIPHGITMDKDGNVFTTDVALHQVFKFDAGNWQKPSMVLGEKFVPGNDDQHFCKPSAVAVLPSGDFFVADGYCNHRILKMAPDGSIILQWGRSHGDSPFTLNVPHALTLVPATNSSPGQVCVADRERGRVACFHSDSGTFTASYSSWLIGGRLFSVAYSPVHGGRLYVVNGPGGLVPVRGYVLEFPSGRLTGTFAAGDALSNPHDVVVSPDGANVYVAELNPYRVYKFTDASLVNATLAPPAPVAARRNSTKPKPTATIEEGVVTPGARARWWGAGAGAAGASLLLALAALALRRATHAGRKSVARRRWEYGQGEFKLRRLLERRRFTRVHSDDSDEEPSPMLREPPATA